MINWKDQSSEDNFGPMQYIDIDPNRMAEYFSDIQRILKPDAKILEVGAMAGRNLEYFRRNGFSNFTAIEINLNAEDVFKDNFPKTYATTNFLEGDGPKVIKSLKDKEMELVMTIGCLQNIAHDTGIFDQIARVSSKYILVKEPDLTKHNIDIKKSKRQLGQNHYHDYESIFEKLGFEPILKKIIPGNEFGESSAGISRVPVLRIFSRY